MSATKRFFEAAAENGMCPTGPATMTMLDEIEQSMGIEWIERGWIAYDGYDGSRHVDDAITIGSARRLLDAGLATAEIADFVETFGDYCPA